MAKNKRKRVAFDHQAEEVEPGVWQWECGGNEWRFHAGMKGVNTIIRRPDGTWNPLIYSKTIDHAVYFSEGVAAGQGQD